MTLIGERILYSYKYQHVLDLMGYYHTWTSFKKLVLVVLSLNLTCCAGGRGSIACTEGVHVGLVIWNMISDILILVELYSKQKSYNTYIDEISSYSLGYSLSFCYPTAHPVDWFHPSIISSIGCSCDSVDFRCVNNSITLVTDDSNNNFNYYINESNYISTIGTTTNDSYHLVKNAISVETDCDTDIWGISDSYRQYFSIIEWQCQYCNCSNSNYTIYDADKSLAVIKLEYEYQMMKSKIGATFCHPSEILKLGKNSWNIDDLIVAAWVFVILGSITSLAGACFRIGAICGFWDDLAPHGEVTTNAETSKELLLQEYRDEHASEATLFDAIHSLVFTGFSDLDPFHNAAKDKELQELRNEKNKGERKERKMNAAFDAILTIIGVKSGVQFIVTLIQDIPHTIIALYLLVFLYSDNGYYCLKSFINNTDDYIGIKLQKAIIDESDSLLVALARNWQVLFSFLASIVTILFNAFFSAYIVSTEKASIKRHHGTDESMKQSIWGTFLLYLTAGVATLMLWTPTMGVLYFYVANAFDKTWTPALILFIIGCICWGILMARMFVYCICKF